MQVAWRFVRIVAGFALVAVGIVGLFLPFLQGITMIVAGLVLLAREFHWARRLLEWVKRRWHSLRDASSGAAAKD